MSVFPHSRPDNYFIFCVGQDHYRIQAFRTAMKEADVPIKPLLGMYKGASEISFIANMTDLETIKPWMNKEESILVIGRSDHRDKPTCTLEFLDTGEQEDLGNLLWVSRAEAMKRDSWTFDPIYGSYYITER